jgi:hypothetical protein
MGLETRYVSPGRYEQEGSGFLTVEEFESLTKQADITAAVRRLTEQMSGRSPA